jgi:PAS domain S-box-containing protein
MALKLKLIGFVVIIALIVTASAESFRYLYLKERTESDDLARLNESASMAEALIYSEIDNHIDRINLISSRTILKSSVLRYEQTGDLNEKNKIKTSIDEIINSIGEIKKISIIDINGTVIISTDESAENTKHAYYDRFLKSKGQPNIYLELDKNIPFIHSYSPLIINGTLIGVIMTISDAKSITRLIETHSEMGDEEYALAKKDEYGNAIYITKRKYASDDAPFIISKNEINVAMIHAINKEEGVYSDLVDYRGVPVYVSTRFMPELDLGLVVKIEESRANAIINQFEFISIIFALILSAIIILISIYVSRSLKKITQSIDSISKGDLNIKLTDSVFREMQSLIDSLNRILSSLKLAIMKTGATKEELGLGEAIKAKEAAEKRYEDLFERATDSIILLDKTGIITKVNNSALVMSGFKREEIEGQNLMTISLLTPKSKLITLNNFRKRLQGIESPAYEIEVIKKDRNLLNVEVTASAIIENGKPTGTMAIIRDITLRKREADAIRKKNEELERFAKLTIGREEAMIQLKKRIAELEKKLKEGKR